MTSYRIRVLDASHATTADVLLDAPAAASTRDLVAALADAGFPSTPVRHQGHDVGTYDTIGALDLTHGATLTCGAVTAATQVRAPGTYLVAVCGPDAGAFWALPAGSNVVGRASDAHCRLTDPLVSGAHLRITPLGDGSAEVEDLGSSNGSSLEGAPLADTAVLPVGGHVQVGATVLALTEVTADDLPSIPSSPEPERPFQRRFRTSREPLPTLLRAPARSEPEASSARPPWLTLLIPLVSGIGFAVISGNWWFLAIAGLGPLLRAGEVRLRQRRVAQRRAAEEDRLAAQRARFEAELREGLTEDQRRRREDALPGGASVLVAALQHRRLWERAPDDTDFLSACVGLAALPAAIEVADGDHGDRRRPRLWGVPLTVPLLQTGAVCILGARDRAQAIGRGLLLNLAATHAPVELQLWVLTEAGQEDAWQSCRLLPHTYAGATATRIMVDAADRRHAVSQLRQLIDSRADQTRDNARPLPVHVVVIDGAHLVAGSELTELLQRGPRQGVVGIVLDPVTLPEGARGVLTLGTMADDARYESSVQPRVDGVITAEVAPRWAELAAHRIAGLRPSAATEAPEERGEIRLSELSGLPAVDAEHVGARWRARSPDSAAVIGVAAGSPRSVDVVSHGPHGLIGGTTRSGKTEFLQTLLASLCLNNHPDDLALLLVDFKGGVDHANTAELPHVLELITNDDIDRFERTVTMLQAEQVRRQQAFRAVEVANLDGYRSVRARDPSVLPIPRLVVIADEFGELLASEVGRAHMSALESVARVGGGLGIHLLLITQNFVGQLPDQIAGNAGLRICFRVEEGAHSRIVLDSDVAASVPASRPGRGWGRLRGGDLFEFQAARVANRRLELDTDRPTVQAAVVPLAAAASASNAEVAGSVPHPETDLYAMTAALRDAAEATGWREPAVPWPGELPTDLPLAAVLDRGAVLDRRAVLDRGAAPDRGAALDRGAAPDRGAEGTAIGLVDLPEQQRQQALRLSDGDEQLLLLGGNRAGTEEVLRTIAVATALTARPDALHLYAIDVAGTTLGALAALPHCGGVAARNDELAARILRHLGEEAASRRVARTTGLVDPDTQPELLLLVAGADRLLGGSNEGNPSPLLLPLARLMSDAVDVRIRIVLAGGPRLAAHRLGSGVERRFVLRCADPTEYSALGVPRRYAADLTVRARAFDSDRERLCQFAELRAEGADPAAVIAAVAEALPPVADELADRLPRPIADVAWPLPWAQLDLDGLRVPRGYGCALPLGVATGTGRYLWVDAFEDGPVIGVAGGAKSGRSSTLLAVARFAQLLGWRVVAWPGSRRSPLAGAGDLGSDVAIARDDAEVAAAVEAAGATPTLVVVDDANRIEGQAGALARALADREDVLVLLAAPAAFLGGRSELLRSLPGIRSLLLVAPRAAGDGITLGIGRLPEQQVLDPRPGRGCYIASGEVTDVQVPLP